MENEILKNLPAECPWRDTLHWYSVLDSTNTQAKLLAQQGAPHGTLLAADMQTGGRGRMGRSFCCKAGSGVYLSVILRPNCEATRLMHLTCAVAVAACNAFFDVLGVYPDIKWINDLLLSGKKVGGILTELAIHPQNGTVDYAIIGIGVNCRQTREDFPDELRGIASSLSAELGKDIAPERLTAALIYRIYEISALLQSQKAQIMQFYREHCITLGKAVRILRSDTTLEAFVNDIDENGSLVVTYADGKSGTVNCGEASIRGINGYF